MKDNRCIKCSIESCKYNDCCNHYCTLKEIKIGCNCGLANCKDDTICDSFEEEK